MAKFNDTIGILLLHCIRDTDYSTRHKDYYERLNAASYEVKGIILLIPLDPELVVLRLEFHKPTTPSGVRYAIEVNHIVTRS